ncbi:putative endochitinase 1, partial [Mimivirus AB-566-O17]
MRTKRTTTEKPNKNIKTKNIHSALDRHYQKHLEELVNEQGSVNKKKQQLKKKKIEHSTTNNRQIKNSIENDIKELEKDITSIESGDRINDYVMNVIGIVTE